MTRLAGTPRALMATLDHAPHKGCVMSGEKSAPENSAPRRVKEHALVMIKLARRIRQQRTGKGTGKEGGGTSKA